MNSFRSAVGTFGRSLRRLPSRAGKSRSRRKRKLREKMLQSGNTNSNNSVSFTGENSTQSPMSGSSSCSSRKKKRKFRLPSEDEDRTVRCVVVGDSGVGKSSLLVRYSNDFFVFNSPEMPAGPVFDSETGHPVPVNVAGADYNLILFDTFSQPERETRRIAVYPGTDVCLICFSVVNPASFENAETKWLPEVRRHLPKVPIILVGTQIDSRDDLSVTQHLHKSREFPVDLEEGVKLARKIKAKCYLECSALTMKGIEQVFDRAILRVLRKRSKAKYTVARKVSNFFGRLKTIPEKHRSSNSASASNKGALVDR